MKKNILVLSLLFSGLWAWCQETTSYITLGATPYQSSCSISPIQGNMQPVKFDVKFTYDQTKEVVTLQMIMRSREYTHVWIPPMQDSCLLRYAKDFTLFRTTRLFRKGLDRRQAMKGVTCSSSRLIDVTNCGLYAVDDTIQIRFRLQNQDVDTFFIVINNLVPIIDKKSFFGLGKYKHHYQYFGGPLRWEIAIQRNPCIMPQNIAMAERVANLKKKVKKVEGTLMDVKVKYEEGCQAYKDQYIPPLVDSLQQIQQQIDKKHHCKNLDIELDSIRMMIDVLSNFQCEVKQKCTNAIAAKHISHLGEAKKKLDIIYDRYIIAKRKKNRKELDQIVDEGDKLIYETATYYEKQIIPECKKRKDVAAAWNGYTKIRDAFKKRTKR